MLIWLHYLWLLKFGIDLSSSEFLRSYPHPGWYLVSDLITKKCFYARAPRNLRGCQYLLWKCWNAIITGLMKAPGHRAKGAAASWSISFHLTLHLILLLKESGNAQNLFAKSQACWISLKICSKFFVPPPFLVEELLFSSFLIQSEAALELLYTPYYYLTYLYF